MDFVEYQKKVITTAIYPDRYSVVYPALGLVNEAGELAGKIKKVLRDKDGVFSQEEKDAIIAEAGDCLWYLAKLLDDLNLELDWAAEHNIDKLKDRQQRGVLGGSGDNR